MLLVCCREKASVEILRPTFWVFFICNIINLLVTVADQQYVVQWFHLLSTETATVDFLYCTTE